MRKLFALFLLCASASLAQFNSGVINNGDFENGSNGWSFYSNASASFTVTTSGAYSGSSAYINITTIGSNTQLYQQPISMQGSTSYTLTFYAKGSNARTVYMSVLKDASPYTNYGLNTVPVSVTTSWQQFTLTFTSPTSSVTDGRVRFDFGTAGQNGDQFWIDNVSLLSGTGGGGTGTLQSDDFSSGSLNSFWSKVDVPGGGTVAVVSNQMVLTVPSSSPHDGYTSGDNALLAKQSTGDIDFTATAQLASVPGTDEGEGLQAIQDNTHFVRCDVTNYGDGTGNHIYSAYISGSTATVFYNNSFPTSSQYWVRLARSGTNWTCSASVDGTNYSTLATFSQQITMSGVAIDADVGISTSAFSVNVVKFTSGTASGGGNSGFNPGLMTNGDFENGSTGWTWTTNGSGAFNVDTNQAFAGNSADITISATGTNTQLYQQPISLAANTNYTFSFYAKANATRTITTNIQKDASPFTSYGLNSKSFTLTTSWQQFTATFNGPASSVTDAQVNFVLNGSAQSGDEFWIDNVSLISNGPNGSGGSVAGIQCQNGALPAPASSNVQPAGAIVVTGSPYNATGNGTTDDTAALTAAINAASSGQTVWFPGSKTYLFSSSLPCKSGVTFMSDGTAVLQSNNRYSGMWAWSCTGTNLAGATWNGLILDGAGLNLSRDSTHEQQANVINTTIRNIWYAGGSGFNGSGIFVGAPGLVNSKISNNTFSHIMANNTTRPNGGVDSLILPSIMTYGLQNTSIDHNTFSYVDEAVHICFESNETGQNIYLGYNFFNYIHRMGFELQGAQGCGGQYTHDSPDTQGMIIEYNKVLHWNDEYYWSYGISNANPQQIGCPISILYSSNPTNCSSSQLVNHGGDSTVVRFNEIVGDDVPCRGTSPCYPGVAIETASYANLVYSNVIKGAFGAAIELSGSPGSLVHDNYACNPFGDGATYTNFIGDENGPNGVTYTNNTVNANGCPSSFSQISLGNPTVSGSVVSDTPSVTGILQAAQIAGVQYYVDGAAFSAYNASPWTLSASTASLANGNHQLTATETDGWCDQYTSGSQTFTVLNTAPTFLWPFQIIGNIKASGQVVLK